MTHIEAGFQHQLKTGAVFVDLTAAYDTVWREGLMIKFWEAVPYLKLFNLLNNMLSNRYLRQTQNLLIEMELPKCIQLSNNVYFEKDDKDKKKL
jgi:hypothetical protein